MREGNLDEAITGYKKALENEPNNWKIRQKLGKALLEKGEVEEAIVAFKQALKINSNLIGAYRQLGDSLMKLKKWDAAINAYGKALKINPQNALFYNKLGLALAEKKQWLEAIEAYKMAIELKPKSHGFYYNLGNALSKLGKNGKAIAAYEKAIALQSDKGVYYQNLGNCLKKQKKWQKAIACYSKAIELNPKKSNNYHLLAQIFERQQQWEEAIKVYKKGLKRLPVATKLATKLDRLLKGQQSQIYDDYEQGILLAKQQDFEKALLCYQELLKMPSRSKDEIQKYSELGIALVKGGKLREVIDIYHKIFNKNLKNLEFYYRFSIRLSQEGLLPEAVAFFEERPKVKPRHLEADKSNTTQIKSSIYDEILTWLNDKNASQLNLALDLDKLESQAAEIELYFQEKKLQVLLIDNLSTTDKKKLKNLGISLEYVKLINVENDALENLYINGVEEGLLNQPRKRTKIYPHHQLNCFHRINKAVEFPHTIAEFQYMYAVDPMTGKVLKTNESFYLGKRNIVYRFVGKEVFYIQTGFFESAKISLYLPKFNLVLSWYKIEINVRTHQKFYNTLNAYLVAYFKDVREYLNYGSQRRVASIVNCINNLGHFFWQEVNGLYYLEKNRLLEKVDYFALGDYEPMEIGSIIPDVPDNKILKIPDMSAPKMFRFFLKNNCFCARVVEHFMNKDYLSRIYNAAHNKCSEDFLKMLNAIREKKETFPLIWFNVRSHNKSWVSQVEGSANIINKLTESFPNLGIVFDGWIDCNEVVENILKLVKTELKVYNTLGCPLHESILWANHIDAYIGVVGSGLVITSWLSNKPGVAYSNRGHLSQERFWSKVKEDAIAPIFLKPEEITPIENGMYGNYEIEWEIIYEKIVQILKQI